MMTVNTNGKSVSGPLAGQSEVKFTTAELAARTQVLIAEMDRRGKKIRRDEWEFGDPARVRIRINYAHRELRIHVQTPLAAGWVERETVSVNLDATDPHFPPLKAILAGYIHAPVTSN
jgi:hypothetical protein